jgi:hypothetical protein
LDGNVAAFEGERRRGHHCGAAGAGGARVVRVPY